MTEQSSLNIHPLSGSLGAEILDADLRDPSNHTKILDAFTEYSVLIIRNQHLSPEDHLAFAKRFGEINTNRFFKPVDGYPQIATVFKDVDHRRAVGEVWHTDHSYDNIPAMGSVLKAIETPETGGDTLFVSMAAAYAALSKTMQEFLCNLSAWHSSRHAFGYSTQDDETVKTGRFGNPDLAVQDALHPVVIRHPLSSKPCLYVNPDFTTQIAGLEKAESDALLTFLYQHCLQPEFQCRVSWNNGDVAMWDNRATWHKAVNDYHGQRRLMHRITIEGCELTAYSQGASR